MSTYLLCIPTFNESEMIVEVISRSLATAIPGLHILVIDDNSPDGTAQIVENLGQPQVKVLRREKKEGLGPAYMAGFSWGLAQGFDFIIEMDADGSHQPEELHRLIEAAPGADLVLGTRWIPGGEVHNWPIHRRAISRAGTWYAELALKLPHKDLTGGFRLYTAQILRSIDLNSISAVGYGFQIEMALRVSELGGIVREVPITFIERTKGRSKMSKAIVWEAFVKTTQWGFQRWFNRR
jgi:dolichol-phosphate mannosyltransferase